jgi:hypothetical protein
MYKILILFTLVLFCSCNNSDKLKALSFKSVKSINLSILIEDFQYVELETTDSSIFSYAKQIIVNNNRLFIMDTQSLNSVFEFDLDGKFVNKISNVGQGPGEYLMLFDMKLNEDKNELWVKDIAQNKILKYDINSLKFKSEFKPNWEALYFDFIPKTDDYLIYNIKDIIHNDSSYAFHIAIMNKDGNVKEFKSPTDFSTGYALNPFSQFQNNGNIVFFSHPYTNIIYEFGAKGTCNTYALDIENIEYPPIKYLKGNVGRKDFINTVRESEYVNFHLFNGTEDNYIASLYTNKQYYFGIFNKKRNEGINFPIKAIIDDLGIGCFKFPQFIYNNYCYVIVYRDELDADKLKNNELLSRIFEESKSEDNPVLLKYRLKF